MRGPLCLLRVWWFQVRTWRGTTALPPGPTSCPLVCTRSYAEERRALKCAAPPERCFDWTTDFFSHFSISAVNAGLGLDVWERALQGYLSKRDASCTGLGVKWQSLTCTETASRTRKYRFTSCLEPTQILAFFCDACVLFLSFFSFLCIFWPLPYWEGTCQLAGGCTGSEEDKHFYTDTRTFNMYRSRKGTMASSIPADSGGLTVHPLVALWSSSVKVYALSHVGKDPRGLFLLSSMIIFAGCWCWSSF